MKLLNFLYGLAGIAVFMVLVWLFAVPNGLIQEKMEGAVSRSGNGTLSLSIDGFKKGIFFSLYADAVNLSIENKPALRIDDFSVNFTPRYLIAGELAFAVKGKIGTGTINGIVKLPLKGNFRIEDADIDAVPYLARSGINIKGHLSCDIDLKGEKAEVMFKIPDLDIKEMNITAVPLLETFRMMQGSVRLNGNNVRVNSISLEGEKGFARLQGDITDGLAKMTLELMPVEGGLNALESMLISRYIISPGYYIVPISGTLLIQ